MDQKHCLSHGCQWEIVWFHQEFDLGPAKSGVNRAWTSNRRDCRRRGQEGVLWDGGPCPGVGRQSALEAAAAPSACSRSRAPSFQTAECTRAASNSQQNSSQWRGARSSNRRPSSVRCETPVKLARSALSFLCYCQRCYRLLKRWHSQTRRSQSAASCLGVDDVVECHLPP